MAQDRIYLDHAATTPMRPEAKAAMTAAMDAWANPSSPHGEGRAAKAALQDARARMKTALGWNGEVIFTSGASEGLAIALRGRQGVATSPVEHDAVLRLTPDAERLSVDSSGIVLLRKQEPSGSNGGTGLLPSQEHNKLYAIQQASNETGVIQPLDEIAAAVREEGGLLLADCAQSAGKLPLPEADMIVLSAHKFGGPPGVGALLVRDYGLIDAVGGQEHGYRPGTENLPGILAMAAALEAPKDWLAEADRLRALLDARIAEAGGTAVAAEAPRIPTIGAYRMPGVPALAQLIQFDAAGISVSAGSACSSGSLKPSRVLSAMGLDDDVAREVVRVSFGWSTTESDVLRFAGAWADMAARKRAA
ncbi:aminotransferase class V-fold PLP-dependent enzyme [Allosphingosinicella flava]|uniref:Cysteine desulfurase n=1 Tax=Allosphingosinicella flava TaxID=2771430 RepID=A0A7T2LN53_9SPHN|nr:aminotransferase class V-fold PLP-dependent enzyme [Sphingosinicella flava]QPQ55837.1 aminotransferase class V-fold PLP-dependent enzyme [Sphingosinicella flava]